MIYEVSILNPNKNILNEFDNINDAKSFAVKSSLEINNMTHYITEVNSENKILYKGHCLNGRLIVIPI